MRLMHRTIVDLPQPDGPMMAVTSLAGKSMSMPLDRVDGAVVRVQVLTLTPWPLLRRSPSAARSGGVSACSDVASGA